MYSPFIIDNAFKKSSIKKMQLYIIIPLRFGTAIYVDLFVE